MTPTQFILFCRLRELLAAMTPDQRVDLFKLVVTGYCQHCGVCTDEMPRGCPCTNDE